MKLIELLKDSNSKAMCEAVVKWVGKSPARFKELVSHVMGKDKLLMQRAVYPMSFAIEKNPSFIEPHYKALLQQMQTPGLHEAVRRNIIRALEYVQVPEAWQGELMDCCFRFITDPKEKPAVKASCLTVLSKLAKEYPEIIPEIKLIMEENWDRETAAFRARARKSFKM